MRGWTTWLLSHINFRYFRWRSRTRKWSNRSRLFHLRIDYTISSWCSKIKARSTRSGRQFHKQWTTRYSMTPAFRLLRKCSQFNINHPINTHPNNWVLCTQPRSTYLTPRSQSITIKISLHSMQLPANKLMIKPLVTQWITQ